MLSWGKRSRPRKNGNSGGGNIIYNIEAQVSMAWSGICGYFGMTGKEDACRRAARDETRQVGRDRSCRPL